LESASPNIQRTTGKGVNPNIAKDILAIANNEGIHNRLMVMYGFPNETREDFEKTLRFVREVSDWLGSIAISRYTPEYRTSQGMELHEQGKAEQLGDLGIGFNYHEYDLDPWEELLPELEELMVSIETHSKM